MMKRSDVAWTLVGITAVLLSGYLLYQEIRNLSLAELTDSLEAIIQEMRENGIMAMAKNIKHLRLILVTECGHWVMVEHEGMFNRACLDFLQNG